MKTEPNVIIVGGGITGLTAAYRLQQLQPHLSLTLLEADAHWGGKLRTEKIGEYRLEAAPDCFLSRKQAGIHLCEELGLASELHGRLAASQNAYVLRHGRLHTLPEGLSGMIPTNTQALLNHSLLSPAGANRVAEEPNIPAQTDGQDESVASFMTRRLGTEAFENIIEPLMAGIYAGRADLLSLQATFPQLQQIEQQHGSLLKGLGQTAPAEGRYPAFVSLPKGIQQLVDALLLRLRQVDKQLNTRVQKVRQLGEKWQLTLSTGEVLTAEAVILAIPAFAIAQLLADSAPDLAEVHAQIPYVSTALVNFAFFSDELPVLPDGYGYVTPLVEGRKALACTWTSQKWPGRAPLGRVLLRVYLGRYGEEDVTQYDDGELIALARQEIAEVNGITANPHLTRIYRWPRALPQYTLGHPGRLAHIDQLLPHYPGLFVAGAAYRGVGIPDCIREGDNSGRAVSAWLGELLPAGGM